MIKGNGSINSNGKGSPGDLADQRMKSMSIIKNRISGAIQNSTDQNQFFEIVRNELGRLTDTRNFYVSIYDEKRRVIAAIFVSDEFDAIPETWSFENSLTGFVIKHKRPLFITKDEIQALAEAGEIVLRGKRAKVWVGIPIKTDDKVYAAFVIQNYHDSLAFDKSLIDYLEPVASMLTAYFEKRQSGLNEIKLSKAMLQSPLCIMITDLSAQIEYVSSRLCELTGYAEQELVGKNVRIFQSGMTDPSVYRQLWNTISNGGEWQGEFQNRKKNGELYWESVNISPIFDSAGVMVNYMAVKEDITERKRSMALLEEARKKAEAADRLKTAFLENISHEIRTPLNGLLGFAPIVLDPKISQKEKEEYLEILNASGKRLMQTVTDYVDISLLVSGNMKVSFKNVNISSLVEDAVLPYYDKCRQKGISLMINLESSLTRLTMKTDPELVKKVLNHLLDNAIKFTHHGGVTLEGNFEHGKVKISIIDTGIGIESDALFNIFDKFFQEDNNRTRNFEGSGLGLAIVTEIMKLLGGNIGAISKKHLGSRFSFSIPFWDGKTEL